MNIMQSEDWRYIWQRLSPEEQHELCPKSGEPWDEEDVEYMRRWYGYDDMLTLAYALERSPFAVREKARVLGLYHPRRGRRKGGGDHAA